VTERPFTEGTTTVAVAVPKPGVPEVMVTEPADTPVTGTLTLPEPATAVTVGGTVATLGLLELRLTVSGLVGAEDSKSIRFCVEPGLMVRPPIGAKELPPPPAVMVTWALPGMKPGDEAVMVTDPGLRPVIWGGVVGEVAPAAMKTPGVTVAVELSLLTKETVAPPTGATAGKVTGSAAD
jgi:hypothetical protein